MGTTKDKMDYLFQTKVMIKDAIREKGVEVSLEDAFRRYSDLIRTIPTGTQVETVKIELSSGIMDKYNEIAITEMTEEGILIAKKTNGMNITADTKILKNSIVYCTAYTFQMPSGSRYLNVTGDHEKIYEHKDREEAYVVFIIKGDCTIS